MSERDGHGGEATERGDARPPATRPDPATQLDPELREDLIESICQYTDVSEINRLLAALPEDDYPLYTQIRNIRPIAEAIVNQAYAQGREAVDRLLRAIQEDFPTGLTDTFSRAEIAKYLAESRPRLGSSQDAAVRRVLQELEKRDRGLGVALLVPDGYGGVSVVETVYEQLTRPDRRTIPVWLAPRRGTDDPLEVYRALFRDLRRGLERRVGRPLPEDYAEALPGPHSGRLNKGLFEDVLDQLLGGPIAASDHTLVLIVQGMERVPKHIEDWGWILERLARNHPLKLLLWGGMALERLRSGQAHLAEDSPFQRLTPVYLSRLSADEVKTQVRHALHELATGVAIDPGAAARAAYAATQGHPALVHELLGRGPGALLQGESALRQALLYGPYLRGIEQRALAEASSEARAVLRRIVGGDARRHGTPPEEELRWMGLLRVDEREPDRWAWTAPLLHEWAVAWAERETVGAAGSNPGGNPGSTANPGSGGTPGGEPPTRSIFVSYAHADNEPPGRWLERLKVHLEPLRLQGRLELWSDQRLQAGQRWRAEIQAALENACAAVLLVSPAFLASKFIRNSELPALLDGAMQGGVTIIPIIIRPCLFAETTFRSPHPVQGPEELSLAVFQAANDPNQPLSALREFEQDQVLLKVARRLHALVAADPSAR